MTKIWQYAPFDETRIRRLSRELRVSNLLAQVLLARGFDDAEPANAFLNAKLSDLHEPNTLSHVPEAAERIIAAIKAGRRITIYGDYDVDGVTSTSLLWQLITLAGGKVDYYIPHRLEEGYGLNAEAIRQLAEEDPQRLIVTVDCGICSVEEAALAKSLGVELIITDHHEMGEQLPDAAVLVHPRLPGAEAPFTDLCGVGVAFKLAWGISQRLGDGKKAPAPLRDYLVQAVGLAAIGTIADVVPLLGENRVIVRYGLNALGSKSSLGLKALMTISGLKPNQELQSDDIGFAIAPRINAAGRLGQARLAVELLTTNNTERTDALAAYLDQLNQSRRTVERKIFKHCKEMIEERPEWLESQALVLAHSDWHAGVIGIVANRVAEQYSKPVILISLSRQDRIGQGSGRSFAGLNLIEGLTECAGHLETFGGHQAAVGLKITAERIEEFRGQFCKAIGQQQERGIEEYVHKVDAEVRLADLSKQAVLELDRLGPFGKENERPTFVATRVHLSEPPRTMGEGDRHLSLTLKQFGSTLRAVAFGKGEWAEPLAQLTGTISIRFAPSINRFRGYETVQLQLMDWQPDNPMASTDNESENVVQQNSQR
ncbi:MAG: single-stranded-DNA-specific exonuclease RecJ [Planctomycetota bacterium]|nr:single-stranded-DNA-specific exonuclease RecJ [Planctomycetota bacterium]MDA1212077.1 single-stranded-DNA-specific exonuclease RecJ [Planctomycetota bacterium]